MLPAFLTTLLWSYCLIPARQSVAQLGENAANFWRLLVAVIAMGLLSLWGGMALGHEAFSWFFLSGIIGFGFGDIGVWFALPRIGSRLTLLMVHCIAAPLAGLAEWLWLGTTVSILQLVALGVVLCGISLALFPEHEREHAEQRKYTSGILFGLLAALGQSMGAVCSRKAFLMLDDHNFQSLEAGISDYIFLGATSGFYRLTGGILIAGSFWLIARWHKAWHTPPEDLRSKDSTIGKVRNILLCAAAGPILGVICYQWALATTPSVIVQLIVSTSPLVILPMTWFIEHDRPSGRSIIGTLIAVVGVLILAFA
ncbi:DMT family transporter [Pontiellaceae bacterium B12227]|nr:DMT family transporter [Pontiellaceae bacterium B12227]